MSELIKLDNEYKNWLIEVSKQFKKSQIKASMKVNSEMLRFYWVIGKGIDNLKDKYNWGSKFYKKISDDLTKLLPNVKSFSPRNVLYMHQFYVLTHKVITPQVVAQLENNQVTPQLGAQIIFEIPWGHIRLILDKTKANLEKALYYVQKTFDNNWSRAVLMNFIDSNLYEREGKAITNFNTTLPEVQGELAQALTKDPYNFDFLTLSQRYNEKELKDALMDNITKFLLELGNGFAFVGREVRLVVSDIKKNRF